MRDIRGMVHTALHRRDRAHGGSAIRRIAVSLAMLAVALSPALAVSTAEGGVSLKDLGWRLTGADTAGAIELSALITNDSRRAITYEVRFIVEMADLVSRPLENKADGARPGLEPVWRDVSVVPVFGGPLAAGASDTVRARVPFNVLQAGKQHRFRAELLDPATGLPLASAVTITSAGSATIAAAGVLGLALAETSVLLRDSGVAIPGGSPQPAGVSGSGAMVGQHEAHRVGGEWVESGSGTIHVRTFDSDLTLNYTYTSHGPSVASLSATATAVGQLVTPRLGSIPVVITTASARMTFPGARRSAGRVIYRSGSTATGTFSGTVAGKLWSGVLTMTNGEQTYNLDTGNGSHRFEVQLTASR